AIQATERKQMIVAGIETHICVYQTATGLKLRGYDVQVVADAVSSRTLANRRIGLEKMKALGIYPTSVEMILYELMESADTEEFKRILNYIKYVEGVCFYEKGIKKLRSNAHYCRTQFFL